MLTTKSYVFRMIVFLLSYAGKIISIQHLDQVIKSVNGWYQERGLIGLVSVVVNFVEILLSFSVLSS